jgi:hypothetical protein
MNMVRYLSYYLLVQGKQVFKLGDTVFETLAKEAKEVSHHNRIILIFYAQVNTRLFHQFANKIEA